MLSFIQNRCLFCGILFCFAAFSCRKSSVITTTVSVETYSFKCWNKLAGSYTNFQSSNSKYREEWIFGDGDTLSVPLGSGAGSVGPINHIYKAPGIYSITLIVNGDMAHKTTQTDTIAPDFTFYYTGVPIVGDSIFFHFYAYLPPGVSYLWTFGDGASSTDSIPYHIYTSNATFTVKLTINGNPANPDLWMQIPIYKDPIYTLQMTNLRLWHGTDHQYYLNDSAAYNVRTTLPDSSFALTFINEVEISYAYIDFTFTPSMSSTDAIVFSAQPSSFYQSSYIYFNHIKDSAAIFLYSTVSGGPGMPFIADETRWHSP